MNQIFLGIVVIAFGVAAVNGTMDETAAGALGGAKTSVEIAIGLVGYMALFLGLMRVAEEGGLLTLLARAIRPIMVRLFPDVPPDHPAMGAMILNIGANALGLTNAATPLGIKAMIELNKLNRTPGVATNAMVMFLALNTSGVALLPSGVVSARAQEGSADPWGIIASTLVATSVATIAGITAAKLLQRLPMFAPPPPEEVEQELEPTLEAPQAELVAELMADMDAEESASPDTPGVWLLRFVLVGFMGLLCGPALAVAVLPESNSWTEPLRNFADVTGDWVIPTLITGLLVFGWATGVKVYESFVKAAREGFETGVMIIPYLVAILSAVGMFRGSGAMTALTSALGSVTSPLGIPPEVLPQALIRPLSGSGAYGYMLELMHEHGPDSYIGYFTSTLQGSTETTLYVLAVYFGAVGITRTRHAVVAGLTADFFGFVAASVICVALFGHLMG
jgi:spore maturation protein SpmA